ncbi:MAG: dimethylamine monooxygenase subunit DmmA family protein [Casimicrobiaceae bacterium]
MGLLAVPPRGPIAVLYAKERTDASDFSAPLSRTVADTFQGFESIAMMLETLRATLQAGRMGLRLYLAGSEHFLWSASSIAMGVGLCADEIQREHVGSLARAVYCVHCKAIAPHVSTNIVACPGCARTLMVRDHYSARLAAYMGFQIDAEAPGSVPAIETLYA